MVFKNVQITFKQAISHKFILASFIAFCAPTSFAASESISSNTSVETVSVGGKKEKKAKKKGKSKKGKGPNCGAYG